MTQPPRTTTRPTKSTKSVSRSIEATLRLDAFEVPDPSLLSLQPNHIWEQLATMSLANANLLELVERAKELATSGQLKDNSISSYANLWLPFVKWCTSMGLASLPACSATVLLYVAYRADLNMSPGTINSDLSAIRSYHLRAGFTNPTDHSAVSMARHSAGRRYDAQGLSRKKAHPLTLDEVRTMVQCLDQLTFRPSMVAELLRIRLKAVLLVAWFTGRRLDEIARAELSWLKERGGVQYLDSNHQKMKNEGFATPIEKITDSSICPWTALQTWLLVSAPLRGDVERIFALPIVAASRKIHLFDTVYEAAQVKMAKGCPVDDPRYPTKAEFEAKCRAGGLGIAIRELSMKLSRWMKFAGIEPESVDRRLSGHSMRRGLVTQLRSAGVDSQVIADHVGLVTVGLVQEYSDAVSKVRVLDALGL